MILFWASVMCAVALNWRDFLADSILVETPANEWLAVRMPYILLALCCLILACSLDRRGISLPASAIFFICAGASFSKALPMLSSLFF